MNSKLKHHKRLPGDGSKDEMIERMIRVNHAGEYGAVRIYAGQLSILQKTNSANAIRKMASQEKEHLEKFKQLIVSRRVRPTAMIPVWHIAGFALGAASAFMGEKAAHACTVAIEEVIDEHYSHQIKKLATEENEEELSATFEKFRQEEREHRDIAIEKGAKEISNYVLMSKAIKLTSHIAIWISKRI